MRSYGIDRIQLLCVSRGQSYQSIEELETSWFTWKKQKIIKWPLGSVIDAKLWLMPFPSPQWFVEIQPLAEPSH